MGFFTCRICPPEPRISWQTGFAVRPYPPEAQLFSAPYKSSDIHGDIDTAHQCLVRDHAMFVRHIAEPLVTAGTTSFLQLARRPIPY